MVLVGPASPGRGDFVSEGLINTNQAAFFQGARGENKGAESCSSITSCYSLE